MKFTFLGTSAGVPTRQRNVSGFAFSFEDHRDWYLVDCGEGTQHRLLHTRYTLARLRAVFITHIHGDHCYGLPGIIASANMSGRKAPLTVCAPDGIEQYVDAVRKHTDLSTLRYPLHFVRSDRSDFEYEDESIRVTAIALSHRVPSYAYNIAEIPPNTLNQQKLHELGIPQGPMWGQLQSGQTLTLEDGRIIHPGDVRMPAWPPRRAVIGGDNDKPHLLTPALKNAQLFVHETTFTEDVLEQVGTQYMHSTARMVGAAAEQAALPHLALTHFSQRYRDKPKEDKRHVEELRNEAAEVYSGNIILARDLDCYELDRNGELSLIH